VSGYKIEMLGERVILPATRDRENLAAAASWGEADRNLAVFAGRLRQARDDGTPIRATAALVHHSDNSYNENAISVSTLDGAGLGGPRHLGYLFDHFLRRVGMRNLPQLIAFAGGHVECTVVLDEWGTFGVELPQPAVLGEAIRAFLALHGIEASGALRAALAPPERHIHTGDSPPTSKALRLLRTYPEEPRPVTRLRLTTRRGGGIHAPRTLQLADEPSGRHLGYLDGRWLRLADERDREGVLALLDQMGVPADRPVTRPTVPEDGSWPAGHPSNVRGFVRIGGLDLRLHDPDEPNSRESFAVYNPGTNVLWVEDSRLAAPALRFMHRQGIDVAGVGVPRRSWELDHEIPFHALNDQSKPWDAVWRYQTKPTLLCSAASLIAGGLLTSDEVTWAASAPAPAAPEELFDILECHVRERAALFPEHRLSGTLAPCRLCGTPASAFTTPIASEPLCYCQACLANALRGLVEDRTRAGTALKQLSDLEFDGHPMLAEQLDSVHVDPGMPRDTAFIDRLLLLRMAVDRRGPWTLLLEASGFGEIGIRTSRGTLIRARDGHRCLSLRERAVCDFLHQHGIGHDREPRYPHDPDYNSSGRRRADWVLSDGTLVELWGLTNDPQYAVKMIEKRRLAERHRLRLIELLDEDLPNLLAIFEAWLPSGTPSTWSWSPLLLALPAAAAAVEAKAAPGSGDNAGRNEFNTRARRERLARCAEAVRLQQEGLSRAEIAARLAVSRDLVKQLLRDGKFYADPSTDRTRAALAEDAHTAIRSRVRLAQFAADAQLSAERARQAWRDADVLHRWDGLRPRDPPRAHD
jgi:hypothetical protein